MDIEIALVLIGLCLIFCVFELRAKAKSKATKLDMTWGKFTHVLEWRAN